MGDRLLETVFFLGVFTVIVYLGFVLFSLSLTQRYYVFLFRLYIILFSALGALFLTGFIIIELVGSKAQYKAIRARVPKEFLRRRPEKRFEF